MLFDQLTWFAGFTLLTTVVVVSYFATKLWQIWDSAVAPFVGQQRDEVELKDLRAKLRSVAPLGVEVLGPAGTRLHALVELAYKQGSPDVILTANNPFKHALQAKVPELRVIPNEGSDSLTTFYFEGAVYAVGEMNGELWLRRLSDPVEAKAVHAQFKLRYLRLKPYDGANVSEAVELDPPYGALVQDLYPPLGEIQKRIYGLSRVRIVLWIGLGTVLLLGAAIFFLPGYFKVLYALLLSVVVAQSLGLSWFLRSARLFRQKMYAVLADFPVDRLEHHLANASPLR